MKRVLLLLLFIASLAHATNYYLAPAGASPAGSDANSGVDAAHPWLSPNHAVNCGDVLNAIAGTYDFVQYAYNKWGTVTCAAGNNVAWVKCATFDACKISNTTNSGWPGVWIAANYWGIQGFEVTTSVTTSATCFKAGPGPGAAAGIHHVIFANNVANGCLANGVATSNSGAYSVDYVVMVGNIAYNAATGADLCYTGIGIYQPLASDTLPGTHIYIAGNFAWDNVVPNPCGGFNPSLDGEGIFLDTLDGSQGGIGAYTGQIVVQNNLAMFNGNAGISVGGGGNTSSKVYIVGNTTFGNLKDTNQNVIQCGDIIIITNPNPTVTTEISNNISAPSAVAGGACGGSNPKWAYYVYNGNGTDHVYNTYSYSAPGNDTHATSSTGFSFGPNNVTGTNPVFVNPVDPGAPNCTGKASVPDCMATVIANFTPTTAAAKAYGYQLPQTSGAQTYDPLFPQWLCNANLPSGLITQHCVTAGRYTK